VAPVVTKTVSGTVSTVRSTVRNSPAAPAVHSVVASVVQPVVEGPENTGHDATAPVESSTPQGETSPKRSSVRLAAKTFAGDAATAAVVTFETGTAIADGQRLAAPSAPLGSPLDQGPNGHPLTSTGTAASSAQSASGSGPGAGL
jgi:hypothetical protein